VVFSLVWRISARWPIFIIAASAAFFANLSENKVSFSAAFGFDNIAWLQYGFFT